MDQLALRIVECSVTASAVFSKAREKSLDCVFRSDSCDVGTLRVTRTTRRGIPSLQSRNGGQYNFFPGALFADYVQSRRVMKQSPVAGQTFRPAALADPLSAGIPTNELEALPFKDNGYDYWTWQNYKVHYVVQGKGKPVVLIHGFGASVFHWRYNIPELARQGYKVYAMDLLGFGWTEKVLIDYSPSLWKNQVADFLKEVVGEPVVLVGNSLGGFTVLYTAAFYPELVSGVALLNASGQFDSPPGTEKKLVVQETAVQRLFAPLKNFAQRWAIAFAFWQAKQPGRVKSVLKNVYKDQTNVDDYLIQSILQPAQDPNAGQVYYRMMTNFMTKSSELTLNMLLERLTCPLLLLWGELDPWIGVGKADKIVKLYPSATLVKLQAGHCPHDEAPESSNRALVSWLRTL